MMKWSKEEDQELVMHVEKFGTAWNEIQSRFSTKRSRNAIIKRWHSRLKDDYGELQQRMSENDLSESETSSMQPEELMARPEHPKEQASQKGHEQQILNLETHYTFIRDWSFEDDEKLRVLVLERHQFDWSRLARQFSVNREEVVRRWQTKIYPQIRLNDKVAGALKWSIEEDDVLMNCERVYREGWAEILRFLPFRSVFSIEARYKRLYAKQTAKNCSALGHTANDNSNPRVLNKYEYRKHIIKRIAGQIKKPKDQQTTSTE